MIVTDEMICRFLSWELPEDFSPDAGVKFSAPENRAHWPTGTNLMNYDQTRQMLEYVLAFVNDPSNA